MNSIAKFFLVFTAAFLLGIFFTSSETFGQQGTGKKASKGFVDANGDGINDNAIDSDGDGIINCLDPDYARPMDGTGRKLMKGNASKLGKGGFGPANGTGNNGVGPKDGTGYGAITSTGTGTGICDGTGPKGNARRGGRK